MTLTTFGLLVVPGGGNLFVQSLALLMGFWEMLKVTVGVPAGILRLSSTSFMSA